MGHGLPDPSEDVDECFRFLLELSRRLGEVQFFSVNRAVSHHAWVKVARGRVLRAYAWAGKAVWDQGDRTVAEVDLGMRCLGYGEGHPPNLEVLDSCRINAEKVLCLAARWSLDPTTIEAEALEEAMGITGELLPFRPS